MFIPGWRYENWPGSIIACFPAKKHFGKRFRNCKRLLQGFILLLLMLNNSKLEMSHRCSQEQTSISFCFKKASAAYGLKPPKNLTKPKLLFGQIVTVPPSKKETTKKLCVDRNSLEDIVKGCTLDEDSYLTDKFFLHREHEKKIALLANVTERRPQKRMHLSTVRPYNRAVKATRNRLIVINLTDAFNLLPDMKKHLVYFQLECDAETNSCSGESLNGTFRLRIPYRHKYKAFNMSYISVRKNGAIQLKSFPSFVKLLGKSCRFRVKKLRRYQKLHSFQEVAARLEKDLKKSCGVSKEEILSKIKRSHTLFKLNLSPG